MTHAAVDAAPASVKELIVPPRETARPSGSGATGFIDDARLRIQGSFPADSEPFGSSLQLISI